MKNKYRIFTVLIWGPVFIIPITVAAILFAIVRNEEKSYQNSLHALEKNIIEESKKRIFQKAKSVSDLITYEKSILERELHERIKQRVYDAHKVASNLYERHHKSMPEKKLKSIIIDALRPLLWNEGESFIWILDYKGIFYLAPEYLRHLEGSSILDLKDASGREIIKEEIALSRSVGEGFIWDTFTKPHGVPGKQYKQLAFVKAFGHYDWYLGSGEYLDTAVKRTNTQLLKTISSLTRQNNDHIFILRHNGDILLHPRDPKIEGENVFTSNKPHLAKVRPLFKSILKNRSRGFVSYEPEDPLSKQAKKKTVYFMQIFDTDWIVGSGFVYNDIAKTIHTEKERTRLQQEESRKKMLTLGVLLVLLSFVISIIISRWIERQFFNYEKKIKGQNMALKELNESLESKVKERTLKLEEANRQLEKLATTDALTQVHNRYFFMESLEAEVKRFQRYQNPFSLIMFDLDHFKQINDRYGHQKGDEILVSTSQLIAHALRETDTLFRFGGEEFMVLLPETGLDKAFDIAERMRRLIEEHDFGLEAPATISIGVAVFQESDSIDSIIRKVDALLYQAKNKGRNSISKMTTG